MNKEPFTLTVEKEDVEQAGPYQDNANCLVATMLKRRGYAVDREMVSNTVLKGGSRLDHTWATATYLHVPMDSEKEYKEQHYLPAVIGKTLTFWPATYD